MLGPVSRPFAGANALGYHRAISIRGRGKEVPPGAERAQVGS
jgi:hypothetical protein